MNKFVWSLILTVILFSNVAFSQEKVYFETLPVPTGIQQSNDPSIPKIGWYRWTIPNRSDNPDFSIHTIDVNQGEYLVANIEQMKAWCLERWGLPNFKFSSEVRIFCAPNVDLMKKLFNLDHSAAEIREENGRIKISYLWIILDGKPAEVIPPALSVICLKEFEKQYNVNLGWWVYRGIPILNATIPEIKNSCVSLESAIQKDTTIFMTKYIFTMTEAEWKKLTPERRRLFDSEAAMFCLLVRKEFGQKNFHAVMASRSDAQLLGNLGFVSFNALDASFIRFVRHLIEDIRQNRTPDTYLQITVANKK